MVAQTKQAEQGLAEGIQREYSEDSQARECILYMYLCNIEMRGVRGVSTLYYKWAEIGVRG
jgi:hypothetical protein